MRLPWIDSFIGNFNHYNELDGGYCHPHAIALLDF
jgi:hypothetical protein